MASKSKVLTTFLIATITGSGAICPNANAVSFDCAKASTFVEQAICDNPTLSKLDDELSIVFKQARKQAGNSADFKKLARNNLKKRENCATDACVQEWYKNTIALYKEMLNGTALSTNESTKAQPDFENSNSPAGETVLNGLVTLGVTTYNGFLSSLSQRNLKPETSNFDLSPNLPWKTGVKVVVEGISPETTNKVTFYFINNKLYKVDVELKFGYFSRMLQLLTKKKGDPEDLVVYDHVQKARELIEEAREEAQSKIPSIAMGQPEVLAISQYFELQDTLNNALAQAYAEENIKGECGQAKWPGTTLVMECLADSKADLIYYYPPIQNLIDKAKEKEDQAKEKEIKRKNEEKQNQLEGLL